MSNLSAPHLSGIMRESPLYRIMGTALTDRIFLIGHADGIPMNDPYMVVSMQEAVNRLGANSDSPLLRALLEVYYAGCRDIFLVVAGPLSEYQDDVTYRNKPNPAWQGQSYYQRYRDRLNTTYNLLLQWDLPQIIIPVEAAFNNTVGADFLTQLAQHCLAAFANTGNIRIGLLGTRGTMDNTMIANLLGDKRLTTQGDAGKFVAVIAGEGTMHLKEMPTLYATTVVPSIAGHLSTMRLDKGLCYEPIRNVMNPTHGDLRESQVKALAEAKINPLVRTTAGRRGTPYQCVLATDNTLGAVGTDFWSLVQVRLVAKVMERVRGLGRFYIGTPSYANFQFDVDVYLADLRSAGHIRDYSCYIRRDPNDRGKVLVDINLKPYFGLREISFVVEIGPTGA